jgi:hypothetical protein
MYSLRGRKPTPSATRLCTQIWLSIHKVQVMPSIHCCPSATGNLNACSRISHRDPQFPNTSMSTSPLSSSSILPLHCYRYIEIALLRCVAFIHPLCCCLSHLRLAAIDFCISSSYYAFHHFPFHWPSPTTPSFHSSFSFFA